MSTRVDGETVVVMDPLLSEDDFLLFCFRLIENHNLENQTRFCSLSLTTLAPLPPAPVSRKRTLRNLPDLLTLFVLSFFTSVFWLVTPSPHLHASSLPPITVSLRNFRVVGCHNCAVPVIQAVTNFFTFSMDQNWRSLHIFTELILYTLDKHTGLHLVLIKDDETQEEVFPSCIT